MMTKETNRPTGAYTGKDSHEHIGLLTPTESLELLDIYRKGATGSLVIGTHRGSRILTTMLPAAPSREAAISQMRNVASQLLRLRCDGYVYLRRMRLRTNPSQQVEAVVIDSCVGKCNYQRIELLRSSKLCRILDWNNRIVDEISTVLEIGFQSDNARRLQEF